MGDIINAVGIQNLANTRNLTELYKPQETAGTESESFGSIFNAYMGLVNETNDYQLSAEQIQIDYAAGRTDDMLAVVLAQEKAFSSLSFTVQVTNKIIESYREIMRIQI
ncbi:hypothetical protein FACS189490_09890 [Clostridia bacterium]|nr:hypothetical protein FACS189490_09890 [Clostridia bacterium]